MNIQRSSLVSERGLVSLFVITCPQDLLECFLGFYSVNALTLRDRWPDKPLEIHLVNIIDNFGEYMAGLF